MGRIITIQLFLLKKALELFLGKKQDQLGICFFNKRMN